MKKLLGIIIILAVLVLGSYYGTGVVTEHTLKKNFAMINQSNGLTLQLTHYQRGWFKSTASLDWRVNIPVHHVMQNGESVIVPAKNYQVQMPLTIYHGPMMYVDKTFRFGFGYARTDLALPAEYVQQFDTVYTKESTKPQINLGIFVNYLNKTYLHADIPKFKLISKQGHSEFDWFGMSTDIRVAPKHDQIEGAVTVDGLTFQQDNMEAAVGKVNGEYDLHRSDNGLYLGDAHLSLPSVLVKSNKQKVFEVEQFEAKTNSSVTQGLFNSTFEASLDKLLTHGKFYGPANIAMALRNIDAQVLAEMNDQIAKIQKSPEADRQRAWITLLPILPKLLNKGAEFEISELKVTVPEGMVKSSIHIMLPNENLNNPFLLLQKIQGQGQIDVSSMVLKRLLKEGIIRDMQTKFVAAQQPALQQQDNATANPSSTMPIVPPSAEELDLQANAKVDEKISALVNTGAIIAQGDHYVIDLKLAQGQLTVNGKPFNASMVQVL